MTGFTCHRCQVKSCTVQLTLNRFQPIGPCVCFSWIGVLGIPVTAMLMLGKKSQNESSLQSKQCSIDLWLTILISFSRTAGQNQGINYLTEGYGASDRDFSSTTSRHPTNLHTAPSKTPRPTTLYSADICNVETFHGCLQSASARPSQMTHAPPPLPPPILREPCSFFFSGGHHKT